MSTRHPWQQYKEKRTAAERIESLKNAAAARFAGLQPWLCRVRREDLLWLIQQVERPTKIAAIKSELAKRRRVQDIEVIFGLELALDILGEKYDDSEK